MSERQDKLELSLDRLQALLQDDAERRCADAAKSRTDESFTAKEAIDAVWRQVGVLPSTTHDNKYWMRPLVQANLYRCPLSARKTTLVEWNTLPAAAQAKVRALGTALGGIDGAHDATPGVVEVPLEYLMGSDENGVTTDRRPVKGNLSDKLAEYTRGMAGQRNRPFRPGGLGQEEEEENAEEKVDPYRTEEAIQRSIQVLDQGSEASWNDGSLITAPPGLAFKVGLSWEDVYGGSNDAGRIAEDQEQAEMSVDKNDEPKASGGVAFAQDSTRISSSSTTTPGMFTRSYFDDDSLFDSSSSESESDEDEERGKYDDDDEDKPTGTISAEPIRTEHGESGIFVGDFDPASLDNTAGQDAPVTDNEGIDQLLAELTISDETIFAKKTLTANPLELAAKHRQNQNNENRKSWASTRTLPIDDFNAMFPNPAMKFPFTLDEFQQQAVARLERSESVFVAAHTSAGKTVVAEYAVALAKQRSTRCIYTSPIKALSNQKFRDFSQKFGSANVGLVTGDLQVNVDDSTCLIMTTEILRSMLYRGADLIRDIEYVVFDEVHYVNDLERGVVWEEVIIMLPQYVNLIFLSATTPNTLEFSDWIGRTKRKEVHVIKTNYRPVPLGHFLWAGNKLHKVLQGNGSFLDKGYSEAAKALLPSSAKDPTKKKGEIKSRPATGSTQLAWQAQGTKQHWVSLVRHLDREFLTPSVVFTFSKKKCEEVANQLRSMDLNTAKERSAVQGFTLQTVARLSANDSKLPQVLTVCEMVQRGIGVHHGGLLPILKEMVEILFGRGLVKILFATETFAMGVNMPAKSVVFNSIRKHDGNQFRVLEPGEYTQMAGRAGRRGLDDIGTVILCCFGETPPPQSMLKQMLTGTSTRLSSNFRLTYSMILNLLKVEEMSVEGMIKRSFSEFATQRALTANEYPQLLARGLRSLEKLEEQFNSESANRIGAEDVEDYYSVCNDLLAANRDVFNSIREHDPTSFDELFQPGRMLLVSAARHCGAVRAPAFVLRAPLSSSLTDIPSKENTTKRDSTVCMILLPSSFVPKGSDTSKQPGSIGYVGYSQQRHYTIREIALNQVLVVVGGKPRKIESKTLFKDDLRGSAAFSREKSDPFSAFAGMKASGKKMDSAFAAHGDTSGGQAVDQALGYLLQAEKAEIQEEGVATIDLHSFVKRGPEALQVRSLCDHIVVLICQLRSFKSHGHPNMEKYYTSLDRLQTLRERVGTLRHLLSNESLQLFPDFLQRKAVLRTLGYIDAEESVCVKGRVACEVGTCEELIVTEIVTEGLFSDLNPEEIVACLSALVYQAKNADEDFDSELPEKLVSCCIRMKAVATNLGQLQREKGLDLDPGEYCDNSLNFGLVHVVYEWALGMPFRNICDLTDAQEGTIVRTITRLEELCREVRNCARVVGNPTLYRKLEAASAAIKRDIVFASSLYVS